MTRPIYCSRCAREFQSHQHTLCQQCRYVPAKSQSLGPSFALRGGQWVLRRGIKVWTVAA